MGSADISLRHIVRRRAEDLARGLVPPGVPFRVLRWLDTQLAATDRRLDKAVLLQVGGRRRALHVEFEVDPGAELPGRVFEYQAMLYLALRAGANGRTPRIKSLVIVLRGRAGAQPLVGSHRVSWPGDPFGGARFVIEPVYQRTVAELRARGGLLWLAFTPLARDADGAAMRDVLAEIRSRVEDVNERGEIYATMAALADLKPWGYSLREEIRDMLQLTDDAVFRESEILQEAFAEGKAEGKKEGRHEGIEEGIERTLRRLLTGRSGREPTAAEQEALARKAHEVTPEQLVEVMALPGDSFLTWLLGK